MPKRHKKKGLFLGSVSVKVGPFFETRTSFSETVMKLGPVLRGNRPFFFSWRFQWNSDQKWRFHVFFRVRTWNLWWFHWNRGFLVEVEALHPAGPSGPAGCKASNSTKNPGFIETTTGFKLLLEKTRETAIFGPSFTETLTKKKNLRFPPNTLKSDFF